MNKMNNMKCKQDMSKLLEEQALLFSPDLITMYKCWCAVRAGAHNKYKEDRYLLLSILLSAGARMKYLDVLDVLRIMFPFSVSHSVQMHLKIGLL